MRDFLKYYFYFLHFALAALLASVLLSRDSFDTLGYYYNEMVAFHSRLDKNLSSDYIVFLGDSHIQGLAIQEISGRSVNYGIGGDTTEGVLKRLKRYNSIENSKAVVMLIGFNDLFKYEDQAVINNIIKLVNTIKRPIILSTILPIDEEVLDWKSVSNDRIRGLNSKLFDSLKSVENVLLLDIGKELLDDNGNLSALYHSGDGIHLNSIGNSIVIDKLRSSLEAYLCKELVCEL